MTPPETGTQGPLTHLGASKANLKVARYLSRSLPLLKCHVRSRASTSHGLGQGCATACRPLVVLLGEGISSVAAEQAAKALMALAASEINKACTPLQLCALPRAMHTAP